MWEYNILMGNVVFVGCLWVFFSQGAQPEDRPRAAAGPKEDAAAGEERTEQQINWHRNKFKTNI